MAPEGLTSVLPVSSSIRNGTSPLSPNPLRTSRSPSEVLRIPYTAYEYRTQSIRLNGDFRKYFCRAAPRISPSPIGIVPILLVGQFSIILFLRRSVREWTKRMRPAAASRGLISSVICLKTTEAAIIAAGGNPGGIRRRRQDNSLGQGLVRA